MRKIFLNKTKWNAFVKKSMSCLVDKDVTVMKDSELSPNKSEKSDFLKQ